MNLFLMPLQSMGLLQRKNDMLKMQNTISCIETSVIQLNDDLRVIKKNIETIDKKTRELGVVNEILLSVQQSMLDELAIEGLSNQVVVFPIVSDSDDDLPN